MNKSDLTFNQAQAYLKVAANVWLFQGQQLVRKDIEDKWFYLLPPEMYMHILSFVVGCSIEDADKIFTAVNKNIRDGVVSASNPGFFSRLVRSKKFLEDFKAAAKIAAEDRYQRRVTLCYRPSSKQ